MNYNFNYILYILIYSSVTLAQTFTFTNLDQKILEIEKDLSKLQEDISNNNSILQTTELKIKNTRALIEKQKKYLAQRLLAQKSLKKKSWFLIFNTQNKVVFDRNLKIFKIINNFDLSTLYEYNLQINELRERTDLIQRTNAHLKELVHNLMQKEIELKNAETARINELAHLKSVDHFLNYKGKLHLPINGKIVTSFGSYHDEKQQFVVLVKGLVMHAENKTPVLAFGPGKVIFSDAIPYWGESIIVSHKGEYYSVYSGLENPKVQLNDFVQNEQPLAETGSKDFYFELRHQDIPINPLRWIRKNHD
jgi:septal ring factor EnvC (AmiA/AmiB activator)